MKYEWNINKPDQRAKSWLERKFKECKSAQRIVGMNKPLVPLTK